MEGESDGKKRGRGKRGGRGKGWKGKEDDKKGSGRKIEERVGRYKIDEEERKIQEVGGSGER